MRHQRVYFGLLAAVLLTVATIVGCGPSQPAALSSSTSFSPTDATPSTSAPVDVSTSSSTEASTPSAGNTPTSDVRLSAAEVRVLQKFDQVRTGLADGTWALTPWPFGAVTSDSPDIAVFLNDPPTHVSVLEKELMGMAEVVRVTYVSKDEMLALQKEIFKNSPEDMAALESEQSERCPAMLEVWLKDRSPAAATKFARKIEGRAGVEEVFGPSVINPRDGDGADLVADPGYPSPSSQAEDLLDEAEVRLYDPDVTASLKASAGDASSLLAEIAAMSQVAKVDFVSLEQAKAAMANEFKDIPAEIPGAQANASPTLEIWLKDVSQSESVASTLRAHPDVGEVSVAEGTEVQDAEGQLDWFYQKPAGTTPPGAQTLNLVDRHDPESVLRAYFSAWERGKWQEVRLYLSATFSNLVPEPAKSLQIIDRKQLKSSSSHCSYSVTFDFVPLDAPLSMESGRYNWTYDLNWDSQRQSWTITNYGEG